MMSDVHTSRHGHIRSKERVGTKSPKKSQRRAWLAYTRGRFVGTEERLHQGQIARNDIYEYQDYVWVFSTDKTLITVYRKNKVEKREWPYEDENHVYFRKRTRNLMLPKGSALVSMKCIKKPQPEHLHRSKTLEIR